MASRHSSRFVQLVDDARQRVEETTADAIAARLDAGDSVVLVDVREQAEWDRGRLPGAIHLGKGVIERDIEAALPNLHDELVLYCGGGYRSVLAADALQRMGYTHVVSMDGGWRAWTAADYPSETD